MIQDMKTTLTRLFTVMMLIMVSMVAQADVKVLFGEKGTEKFEGTGGTIEVKQEKSQKDASKITVYLSFIPKENCTFVESSLEVYAVISPDGASTRALEISGDPLDLTEDKSEKTNEKHYHVDIDSKLALWVKSADFKKIDSGAKATTASGWNGEGYYYIINRGLPEGSDWYLKPATAYYQDNTETPFLTTNTTGQVAGSLWIITLKDGYRQVIHAEDGKYVTTNGYVLSNNKHRKRIHLEKKSTPGDDNDFVFDPNGDYFNISHKTMSEGENKYWNPSGNNQTYDDGGTSSGNFSGIVGLFNGITGGSLWELVFVKKCVTPKITVEEENVTITSLTSEAAIYYTDDDSDPATSETRKRYNAAFSLGSATKIRAIATKTGFDNSDEATYSSTRCKTPTIILNKENGLTTITPHTDNSGAFIYYTTNGSTPTVSPENKYTEPFILSVDATIIKAIAAFTADGSDASDEVEQTLIQLAPPTFTKNGATIAINKPTKDTDGTDLEGPTAVEVRFNKSNTDPTSSSDPYTSSIAMEEDFNSKIVKARAFKSGYIKSEVASLNIDQCAKPTLVNNFDGTVTMTCATSGATIRYTIGASNVGNPTKSSTNYSENQLSLDENNTYTTIKVRAFLAGYCISDVLSYSIPLCPAPYFSENGETVKINCSLADAKIYYRTSSSGDWTEYNNESITPGDYLEAYAGHKGYVKSGGVVYVAATTISSPSEITNMSGSYILSSTFSGTIGTSDNPFTGTLDGQLQKITITAPIVAYADGATIKNIIVELGGNLSTGSTAGHVGAIVCEAKGNSRIYNCGVLPSGSNTISGTGNVGGIVGNLDGNSHVVNCYSFATISGGNNVGGIVGNNTKQTKRTNISSMVLNSTMVMNCMFYGNISGGTKVSPIYGGETIVNDETNGLNNFNYFRQDATINGNSIIYNCALAMEERYLKRVEFFRNLLNSNRELAAIYATGDASKGQGIGTACEMAKWVLDKSIADYPILKVQGQYTSIVNFDKTAQTGQETLKIYLLGTSIDVPITSKDPKHFNYNYRMVQLPYYNDYATDNYQGNRVVTGWEISVTGKSGHIYDAYEENNFANPNCISKYAGRVFSQGAYFDVPEEVTEISLTPHWAQCVYLSDASYDATGYRINADANNPRQVTQLPRYTNGTAYNINGSSQVVYTLWANAISNLPTGSSSVYDRAIVLVGNYHNSTVPPTSGTPFTIMSADLNHDNEPDYSLIYFHNKRNDIMPIRFDFLNVPGTSMAQKVNGTGNIKIAAVMRPKGWFEVTNTCLIRFSQFEHDSSSKTTDGAPVILLGGIYEQLIASHTGDAKQTSYIHLGSNAWVNEFSDGSHVINPNKTTHAPISITGGQYGKFYLSGIYRPDADSGPNNHARCYINGGEFTELAGAGQEQINGNVTWQINNAHITNFYGGGINANKPITGNISITINGGRIETFCGGPKFGNMSSGKSITTTANGTTFGTFFGAGYGGTSLYRDKIDDKTYDSNKGYNPGKTQWNTWANNYVKGKYVSGKGIAANFEYEFIDGSEDYTVARLFVNYASFSLAETNDVESTLNKCIIEQNFYGGGNLGKVNGTATSTLNGCEVHGNVYGAGYSAAVPWVDLMNDNNFVGEIYPKYDTSAGVYNNETVLKEGLPGTTRYTWSSKGSVSNNSTTGSLTQDDDGLWIHTGESLTSLGTVSQVVLNIDEVTTYGNSDLQGNVYGGGQQSAVSGGVSLNMHGGNVAESVFGGGEAAEVVGNTTVNLYNGEIVGNVFGGGDQGKVSGSATVNLLPEPSQQSSGNSGGNGGN